MMMTTKQLIDQLIFKQILRICIVPGHCFVAVKLNSVPTHTDGWRLTIDDKYYYICETTMYGWLVEDCPEDYQSETVYSYPVL